MRTLSEIVEEARDGGRPTHDECLYSMLTLSYLLGQAGSDLGNAMQAASGERRLLKGFEPWKEEFKRTKRAYQLDPEKYLGSFHPQNPDHQRERKTALRILEKLECRGQEETKT